MTEKESEKKEPIKLYGTREVAEALGIRPASLKYHLIKGTLPQPTYVATKSEVYLWTAEQLKSMKSTYVKGNTGPTVPLKKPKKVEKIKAEVVEADEEDGFDTCSDCGAIVFNMKVHIDFAHRGKYSAVGATTK